MEHELRVFEDLDALSRAAAELVAASAREAVDRRGAFHLALSGGRSPWEMITTLTALAFPWERTVLWQVDERVAPAEDPDRNLRHLRDALGSKLGAATLRPMPVEETDLDAAAVAYGDSLPERLDLVHLGIGPDGHTASLVPTDPVLEVADRPVAVTTSTYQGRRRMTFTYPGLRRAGQLLWLVSGGDKHAALEKLLASDTSIPAGRVVARSSLVLADREAAG